MNYVKFNIICFIVLFTFTNQINITELENKILAAKNLTPDALGKKDDKTCIDKDSETPEILTNFNNAECDLVTDGPICIYNGDRVLLPWAKPNGLVGYWNFDEMKPLDNSGNKLHAIGIVKPGPAFGGLGSSALFSSGDFVQVPFNNGFDSKNFSITFWLFVVQDFFTSNKGIRFCPFIQRGEDDLVEKKYQRSPGIYFDRKDKNFVIFTTTSDKDNTEGETLTSNAKITYQRWLHVSLVKDGNKLKLYVNGILDAQVTLKGDLNTNNGPLFIGNTPWLKDQCDFPFLLDELRYYDMPVEEDKIQAEASPVLGGIEPNFIRLGCMECTLEAAAQVCKEGYRLCSSIELHTGGYQIARSMGWLNWNTHIWTNGALKTPKDFENLKGLGLCCAELK
jgi:hypothetical protein